LALVPTGEGDFSQEDYHHPAAGWGAAISVSKVRITQGKLIDGTRAVFKMNHENGGYDCPGCAWPDDRKGLRMDICELNRSHLIHGRDALILPCLGRTEKDEGKEGLQGITVEDSMSMVHLSYGMKNLPFRTTCRTVARWATCRS
jgi:hypothetical protein